MGELFSWIARYAAAAFLLSAGPAPAGTIYDFNAASPNPIVSSLSFTLRFDDTSGDGLLQFGEIVPGSFSGVLLLGHFFDTVEFVPNIPSFTSFGGSNCTDAINWFFGGPAIRGVSRYTNYAYSITPVSAVPLPRAFFLLATAFGALGLMRWWRNRRAKVVALTA